MKYIIVEDGNLEKAIIFDPLLNHSDVGRGFHKVISAGFCSINTTAVATRVDVWGESVTLNIKSRKEDAGFISSILLDTDFS
jgi:hypothetical protein